MQEEYEYYYQGAEFYCYPNTSVLINKFGVRDAMKLDEIERKITGIQILEFAEKPIIPISFDFKYFCKIHKFLFDDIYDWAGIPRKGGFMSKGRTTFARADFIESLFSDYYEKLKKENFLRGLDKSNFCERLAYYMAEVNCIHPFREGNGRTMKTYFALLAKKAGYFINFSLVDKDELILADVLAYERNYKLSIDILEQIATVLEEK